MDVQKYTGLKHPIQNYPYRLTIDIIKPLIPFIENKSVCDIGCGAGDILFEIGKYAKSIIGIERHKGFKNELDRLGVNRDFIIWGDLFSIELPIVDVYYLWISSDVKLNRQIVDILPKECIIIDATTNLDIFSSFYDLQLIKKIDYEFDESNLLGNNPVIVGGVSFETKGTKIIRIYKKITIKK